MGVRGAPPASGVGPADDQVVPGRLDLDVVLAAADDHGLFEHVLADDRAVALDRLDRRPDRRQRPLELDVRRAQEDAAVGRGAGRVGQGRRHGRPPERAQTDRDRPPQRGQRRGRGDPGRPGRPPCRRLTPAAPRTRMPSEPLYLTTPLFYVNAEPHLGHFYVTLVGDVLARFWRARGRTVFTLTGTDEHGDKIAQAAAAAGVTPQAHADRVSALFRSTWEEAGLRYDHFIRTTDATTCATCS